MGPRLPSEPIREPPNPPDVTAETVMIGIPIPPIERIRLFDPQEWEDFILEWVDSLRIKYELVERCAGSGDLGRDIIGKIKGSTDSWDYYQCKHYSSGLQPNEIWIELGKLVYHSSIGNYPYPNQYFFVAPSGAGPTLSNLLRNPSKLKSGLRRNWDSKCRTNITNSTDVELNRDLLRYIDGLDFSIFQAVSPLVVIDQHRTTRWHVHRFGGGLPPRPKAPEPPDIPMPHETNYVHQLLLAYDDYSQSKIETIDDLIQERHLDDHFRESRIEFYSAEALRAFSRDRLPPGAFESLQNEVHHGIMDTIRENHHDGYKRVLAVVKMARIMQIGSHPLHRQIMMRDRGGICHQLANDSKVRWIQ